jgi:HK97 gp10 family phage protein
MKKSELKGGLKLRVLLQTMPKDMTREVLRTLEDGAQELLATMLVNVPKGDNDLAALLTAKKRSNGFEHRVGLNGKKANRLGFYGRFPNAGTKDQPAQPWLEPSLRQISGPLFRDIDRAVDRALARFSRA